MSLPLNSLILSSRCDTDRDLASKSRYTHEEPSLVLRPRSWTRPSKDLLIAVKQRPFDSPNYVIP